MMDATPCATEEACEAQHTENRLLERIAAAPNGEQLQGLIPAISALPDSQKDQLRAAYKNRMIELRGGK